MRWGRSAPARWRQVPEGVRDLVPEEAEHHAALAGALREAFRRWGYRTVATPTLEYLETFLRGADAGGQDQLFKIVDRGGELLALRPEMTVPIARLAATRLLQGGVRPLRLAYVAPVFRGQDAGRGALREFTQAGVELLGDESLDADAEVIALAAESLRIAEVDGAILHLNELGFLDDVLGELGETEQDEVRTRLFRRELAGLGEEVSDPALARFLRALPDLHGPEAVPRAAPFVRTPRGRAALDRLAGILERLEDYGSAAQVNVDFSLIRDFTYYTGIVFEAYGPGMGYPLLGGGRYDTLLGRFGAACPATGFALGIERVLAAAGQAPVRGVDVIVAAIPQARAEAIDLTQQLRRLGKAVVVVLDGDGMDPLRRVIAGDAARLVRVDGDRLRVIDTQTQTERLLHRDELLADLAEPETVPDEVRR